ncbi:MAG: hypothetical protein KTR22_01235 [Flavobacteriaceae bacterium]|nr:hypothetical protein [Flavobacteriaceae bacterium]
MSSVRQLAAIMFTDIEGYTAVMGNDEEQAISIRNKHRSIFDHTHSAFEGKIVQYFGDGTLSIFTSAVQAVECALELQLAFIQAELPVRIGIHMGDIVYSQEDIIGDAVNIASRIESCAMAGSILISDKVHDQIRNQPQIKTEFLDAFEFKNVEGTIPLFAITNEGLKVPDRKTIKGKLKEPLQTNSVKPYRRRHWFGIGVASALLLFFLYFQFFSGPNPPDDLSIAVLPFENLSTDPDSDLFRDGITEDLLTQLSKLSTLRVISRKSVDRYRDSNVPIQEIAKELNVSLILEGSIRKKGDQVRVSAHLIKTENEEQLWADTYDKTLTDIFTIQTEISEEIVNSLEINLTSNEQSKISEIQTQNIEAYKLFLMGRKEADKRNRESIAKSIQLYEQALELDPNYAEAMAEIANSIYLETYYANRDPEEAANTAKTYLERAEKINDKVVRIYSVLGLINNIEGKYDQAKAAFERAITISPNDVTTRRQYSTFFYYNRQYEEQLVQAEIAYRLDPLSFVTANSYFNALVENYKFEEAERLMKQVEKSNVENNEFVINRSFFRLYTAMEDYERVIPHLEKLSSEEYAFNRFLAYSYGKIGDTINTYRIINRIKNLKKADTGAKNYLQAMSFAGIKEVDSIFYYLDTLRTKQSSLLRREHKSFFECIHEDPRYPELLKAHGIE